MTSSKAWLVPLILGLAVGAVIGFYVARWTSDDERRWATVVFTEAVQQAGVAAETLRLLEEGRTATVVALQGHHFRSGLDQAAYWMDRVDGLEFPMPETVELATRAQRYAERHQELSDVAGKAATIARRMSQLSNDAL